MSTDLTAEYPWQLNGHLANTVSPDDRAFQFGDGLFETMRVTKGIIPLLDSHIERLSHGCKRLRIPFDAELVCRHIQRYRELVAVSDSVVLKLIVSRGAGPRGYKALENPTPTVALRAYEHSAVSWDARLKGVETRLCGTPLACNPALAGIKHLNRLEQILARSEWSDPNVFEGLMVDVDGYLVEGTMSNLFFVREQVLCTPDLSRSGVCGVMRKELIDLFTAIEGRPPMEVRCGFQELAQAEEVFLSNSVIGAIPVRRCEHMHWQPGRFAQQAQAHVASLFNEGSRE